MRLRGNARRTVEWLLRAALLAGLALALWRSTHEGAADSLVRRTSVRGIDAALAEATRSPRVRALDVGIDSMPGAPARAWLAALRDAGVRTTWHGTPPALAVQVERSRDPEARARISVTAPTTPTVHVADSAGTIDSLGIASGGATIEPATAVGAVRATQGRFSAVATVPPATLPRAVLVLGRAGWESKFTADALQEAGWTVHARQPAAPGVVVEDANIAPIDTAHYAVVVALDSTAADLAPALARFVAQGGGLVLAGNTSGLTTLASIAPARTGAREPGRILLDADSVTRPDLPLRPLAALRGDAVRLEGTPAGAAVAVRRAGLGRVLTVGYDETWRWRMLGGASGADAHRAWWSRTVGLVAPSAAGSRPTTADAAPLAALVAALGPASTAEPATRAALSIEPLPLALLVLLIILLLAETASRRFRGAR